MSTPDQLHTARLMGCISKHATAHTETVRAVAEIRTLADGRDDLLREVAATYRATIANPAAWYAREAAELADAAQTGL